MCGPWMSYACPFVSRSRNGANGLALIQSTRSWSGTLHPLMVLEQFVLDGVREGVPRGLDGVLARPDRAPNVGLVPALDRRPHPGSRPLAGVHHPHLVVHEVHVVQRREYRQQGVAD